MGVNIRWNVTEGEWCGHVNDKGDLPVRNVCNRVLSINTMFYRWGLTLYLCLVPVDYHHDDIHHNTGVC